MGEGLGLGVGEGLGRGVATGEATGLACGDGSGLGRAGDGEATGEGMGLARGGKGLATGEETGTGVARGGEGVGRGVGAPGCSCPSAPVLSLPGSPEDESVVVNFFDLNDGEQPCKNMRHIMREGNSLIFHPLNHT